MLAATGPGSCQEPPDLVLSCSYARQDISSSGPQTSTLLAPVSHHTLLEQNLSLSKHLPQQAAQLDEPLGERFLCLDHQWDSKYRLGQRTALETLKLPTLQWFTLGLSRV